MDFVAGTKVFEIKKFQEDFDLYEKIQRQKSRYKAYIQTD